MHNSSDDAQVSHTLKTKDEFCASHPTAGSLLLEPTVQRPTEPNYCGIVASGLHLGFGWDLGGLIATVSGTACDN